MPVSPHQHTAILCPALSFYMKVTRLKVKPWLID